MVSAEWARDACGPAREQRTSGSAHRAPEKYPGGKGGTVHASTESEMGGLLLYRLVEMSDERY